MLDPLIIEEIQALRVKLHHFGSGQQNPAVQFHCLAVDSNLAQALDGRDDPMLREVLASSVEQLENAVRSASDANLSNKEADETAHLATPKTGASLIKRIAIMLHG